MEVKEMTIADVLKMPLFFENVKRQLTSLWNDREKAREDATRNNTRLRAHVIDRMHNPGIGNREISLFFSQKFWIRSQPGIRRANGRLSVRLE